MTFALDDDMRNTFFRQYLRSSQTWDPCPNNHYLVKFLNSRAVGSNKKEAEELKNHSKIFNGYTIELRTLVHFKFVLTKDNSISNVWVL